MAVSKITTWKWTHKLNEQLALSMQYDLYADMANGNAQPYLRLNKCDIRTLRNDESWLSPHVPFTIKLQINDETRIYTFSSGNTRKHWETDSLDEDYPGGETIGFYYVQFSSSTNINIPKDGEPFTIHIEVVSSHTHEEETVNELEETVTEIVHDTYTVEEHPAGPISNSITGPAEIVTGEVATYTLSRALKKHGNHIIHIRYWYHFKSWGSNSTYIEGYADPYTPAAEAILDFTEFGILPLRGDATPGEKSIADYSDLNILTVESRYDISADLQAFSDVYGYFHYNLHPNPIVLGTLSKTVVTIAKDGVDESLRPEFVRVYHDWYYTNTLARYGAAVQNRTLYNCDPEYRMQYGSYVSVSTVRDYTSEEPVIQQYAYFNLGTLYEKVLDTVTTDAQVQFEDLDSIGFLTSYTDTVTVIPYYDPVFTTCSVRRCSPVSSSSSESMYPYNGVTYQPDDYGEYALIEWGVDIAPLNNINTRSLHIKAPSATSQSGYTDIEIELTDYVCSGYFVTSASPERSYDVEFRMTDDYHGDNTGVGRWILVSNQYNFFSDSVVRVCPLNTSLAMIDFKHGGTGIALGKVSELDYVFDIHRNWLLKMPYDTRVNGYYSDGSSVRIYDWMQQCVNRIQGIADSRDWGIYGYHHFVGQAWFDGYTKALIPEGYGEVYDGGNYRCMMVVPNRNRTVGITTVEPFIVNRNYLNIRFNPSQSWRGQGFNSEESVPTIYLCSTRPTWIDQSTGRPDATIVSSQRLTGNYEFAGSSSEGFTYWDCTYGYWESVHNNEGALHSFDVSSYSGQPLWFVMTCTQGGQSQTGYYIYNGAQLNIYDIMLSDTRLVTTS